MDKLLDFKPHRCACPLSNFVTVLRVSFSYFPLHGNSEPIMTTDQMKVQVAIPFDPLSLSLFLCCSTEVCRRSLLLTCSDKNFGTLQSRLCLWCRDVVISRLLFNMLLISGKLRVWVRECWSATGCLSMKLIKPVVEQPKHARIGLGGCSLRVYCFHLP